MSLRNITTLTSALRWPVMAEVKPPGPGVVQVWCAILRGEPAMVVELEKALSVEEGRRATGCRTEELRHRFVLSRGVLRKVLGKCLEMAPEQVRLHMDVKGKPRLIESRGLEFNLSHSADLMLLAVTRAVPVGVDVERIRRLKDSRALARRFFSKREADWLQRQNDGELDRAFFRLWTRKEAILKAIGDGIWRGLASHELLKVDGSFSDTVTDESNGRSGEVWAVHELEPATGFVGALAVPDRVGGVQFQKAAFHLT